MKKIIITLTLLFSFLLTFSQDFSIAKSSRMSFGEKNDYTGEFKFNPFTEIDEVLILIEPGEVRIKSRVPQHYEIDSAAIPLDDMKGSYWYALDDSGTRCRVYLYMDDFSDVFVAVEYSDYSWIYNVKPVK